MRLDRSLARRRNKNRKGFFLVIELARSLLKFVSPLLIHFLI